MTDDPVEQALADLQDLVRCRCHPAYTDRGLRDPDCECDSTEAVKAVADHIETQAAEIERLRGEVAMAVEALEKLSTPHSFSGVAILGRRLSESLMGREIRARMEYARATLAELKGAKP